MNTDDVYKAHEQIGFPEISEKEQADILIWHNVDIINNLTPNYKADYIPPSVAKKYIKLSKDKFRKYFIESGYLEKTYDTHLKYTWLDNKWVEKINDSKYQLKVQVRGILIHIESFEGYDTMIDFFVKRIYKTYNY